MTARPKWAKKDPDFERERAKYGKPAPSRRFILQCLDEAGGPLTKDELIDHMGLASEAEREGLERRLSAMLRDGELVLNRRGGYGRIDRMNLVRGLVMGHPDGYGFLSPDDGGKDIFLPPKQMAKLFHGDRALVRCVGDDQRGRREGSVVEVLERNTEQLVGRFLEEGGVGLVAPDNPRITQEILIPPDQRNEARPGQLVVVDILEQPGKRRPPLGRVREVLGDRMAPGMEIDVAIRAHGIPHEWPEEVREEAKRFGTRVPTSAKKGREDLRDLPLVTIDGADAKDFDDAVYCEPSADGWRLLVAIADVSHYVKPGSALDREAFSRGNSVYFPGQVVPMLPEVLSNGLCSLNPKVDRLCLVCAMDISTAGELRRYRFVDAVMRSSARLTYEQYEAIVVAQDAGLRKGYEALVPHLENLYGLYRALRHAREQRGAIDFDLPQMRIEFDAQRKIASIEPTPRLEAHKVIEECMIAANVAASSLLKRHRIPTLYRNHERPSGEKLQEVRDFLGEFGLKLGGGIEPTPKDYAAVLAQVADRPERGLIETVLLRSMQRAVYSADPQIGHFGLAHESYAHFTSPIRRYPDLLVHRGIRHVMAGGDAQSFPYDHSEMERFGNHCSETEMRADEATRDVEHWLKCEFMSERVGQDFDARISGVVPFGLFVTLEQYMVDGLVHVSSLTNDYYEFDAVGRRLCGTHTGSTYRLGDRMRVRLVRVDLDERKIDFEPVPKAEGRSKGRSGGGRGKSGKGARKKD